MDEAIVSRVLVVDDQTLYREALRELVGHWKEFNVIGEAANGVEAVEFCKNNEVDIVLMDISMPVMDGIEATKRICTLQPKARVVMLTVEESQTTLIEALKAGARGYILKDTPSRMLHGRLRDIQEGQGALSGPMANLLIDQVANSGVRSASSTHLSKGIPVNLTPREMDILRMVAKGLSNDEIGTCLYISSATVKKTLGMVMQKLHLDNRVQVAVYAVRQGLVD